MTRRDETSATEPKPVPGWVAPVFGLLGLFTVPWTVYLAVTLPDHVRTSNYRQAWVGFDLMLMLVLLLTGYLAWRAHRTVALFASSAATMLLIDAWFDITTSGPSEAVWSVLLAVVVELPLAALCGWLAMHTDRVVERRLRQLARRAARAAARTPAGVTAGAGVRAAAAGVHATGLGAKAAGAAVRAAEEAVERAEEAGPPASADSPPASADRS